MAASFPGLNCKEMCVNCLNIFVSTTESKPVLVSSLAIKVEEGGNDGDGGAEEEEDGEEENGEEEEEEEEDDDEDDEEEERN